MIILLIDSCVPLSQINSFFKARALLRHGVRRKARTVSPSCAMRHFKHSLKLFKDIKPKKNTIQRYYRNFADILLVKICQVTQMIWGHLRGTRNHIRRESVLHSEMEALRWTMESMLQYSTCQSFGLQGFDYNDQRASCLSSFATELERIETLKICFPDFKITNSTSAKSNFRFLS